MFSPRSRDSARVRPESLGVVEKLDPGAGRKFKFAIVGDSCVGKTALLNRWLHDAFIDEYCLKPFFAPLKGRLDSRETPKAGPFVAQKSIDLPHSESVTLQVVPGSKSVSSSRDCVQAWEIKRASREEVVLEYYLYGSDAVLFIYDLTQRESFESLTRWMQRTRACFETGRLPYFAIVAHKVDLSEQRAVSVQDHNAFVRRYQIYSYQASAKTGANVAAMFPRVAADLLGMRLSNAYLLSVGAMLMTPKTTRSAAQESPKRAASAHSAATPHASDAASLILESSSPSWSSISTLPEQPAAHFEDKGSSTDSLATSRTSLESWIREEPHAEPSAQSTASKSTTQSQKIRSPSCGCCSFLKLYYP